MKALLLILALVFANAVFVKKVATDPNMAVFTQLESIEETELGKRLLDTIALQMKNKSPLSDIAKMLQDLRENLILQQQEADLQNAATLADCEAEIYGYNRRIEFASNEITESSNEIQALTQKLNFLEAEIENATTQLNILNEQEQVLRDTREKDHEDFKQRESTTPMVIEALDVIASKLGSIQPESDAEAVLAELHKIGGENPILALLQLASTFSAEQLASVQDKIAELRASLEQALEDDREAETQAQLDFESLISQMAQQRQDLNASRNDAQNKVVSVTQQLGVQRKRKNDAAKELDAATRGKTQKEAECEAWKTQYARDSEHRVHEIGIIRQIEEILATKLEGASSYLKDRIGA